MQIKRCFFATVVIFFLTGCNSANQGALPSEHPPHMTRPEASILNRGYSGMTTTAESLPPATSIQPQVGTTANQPVILSMQEQHLLNLINQERTKMGLIQLTPNEELGRLARLKAQDMVQNNYFSHVSPTFGSPFDMISQAGVTYSMAAENIAGNNSLEGAHQSLMNSPGHRANILNGSYNQVGVGIVPGGPYGYMFVEMFIRK